MASIGEESFRSHVERVRGEIQDKFLKAHKVLRGREAELLAKVEALEDDYIGDRISQQIQQLTRSKSEMVTTITGNDNQDILEQNLANVNTRIKELQQKLRMAKNTYLNVTLEWDIGLEDKLSLTGDILLNGLKQQQVREYKNVIMPVVTFGKHRENDSSPGAFCFPVGVTIHPATRNMYICDVANQRVQVFNESFNFVFLFNGIMDGPNGICIQRNKVYVTQYNSNRLNVYSTDGKCLESVGGKGKNHLEFHHPKGVDISIEKNRIYIAEYGNDRVQCLNLDLTYHSTIEDVFAVNEVKLTAGEVVVLSHANLCVSLYSYSHQLIRKMIPRGEDYQLRVPCRFVLDKYLNILICDSKSHSVCIYSYTGELVHKFGQEGGKRGDFINPTGITTCSQGRIIVISANPNNCVQVFQ